MRYDHGVLVLIEVRGGAREWERAENTFTERGWPIVEPGSETSIVSGVIRPHPESRFYLVEVRLFGALNGRVERAARWRVENAARRHRLEMYPRRTELVCRDREMLPEWAVAHSAHEWTRPRERWSGMTLGRRLSAVRGFVLLRLGRYDTGGVVSGTASEARRLARMQLSGGRLPSPDLDVRRLDGRGRRERPVGREEELSRAVLRMFAWYAPLFVCATYAAQTSGGRRLVWGVLGLPFLTAGLRVAGRWSSHGDRAAGITAGGAGATFMIVLAVDPFSSEDSVRPLHVLLVTVCGFAMTGIWLVVRQWTIREWAAWVVPAAVAVLISMFVASGSVLHSLYADEFALTARDLAVPPVWQFASAVKLLSFLWPVFLVVALWGAVKHFHWWRPGEGTSTALYVLALVVMVVTAAGQALESVQHATDATRSAARSHRTPPTYFGIQPVWVCIQPTTNPRELNENGGRLRPERPYISFGSANGHYLLWDPSEEGVLKVPSSQTRSIPAGIGAVGCTAAAPPVPRP